jgi:hypothetical protein
MERKMVQPTNLKNIVVFLKRITLLIIRGWKWIKKKHFYL